MGLHPLEFSECYLDSPAFREKIKAHEAELDKTGRFIKELYKDGKNLINATKQLSLAQKKFAQCLGEFKFEYIGDDKTDDEKCIGEFFFSPDIFICARAYIYLFISSVTVLFFLLSIFQADMAVEVMRQHFQVSSLEYVCKLQEIQERKKFECVEPMLAFFQTVFTFYHQGYELAKDFDHYKKALQINIQNTRSRFEGTRSEVFELMKRIKDSPQEYRQTSPISSEGYLYVQEKRPPPFGSSWVKRYSTFVKEQKILHMKTFDQRSGGKLGETESVTIKSCVRKTTDTLDRRFCLDIEITDRPITVLTVQALSDDDHRFWMHAMGGKEPVRQSFTSASNIDAQLDDLGISFVKNSINAIETRGINDQGLYRVVGVSSKVQKLLSFMIDEKSCEIDLAASEDWDVKTITSALKLYLSATPESRVQAIHCLVHKLPERNRLVLSLVTKHLAKVAANSKQNLMTVANLGVVFGPTLMRPQEETVAAIMDLKFQNIVVEILIEQHEKVRLLTGDEWPHLKTYVTLMKAKAVYPCEAEHDSELSFQVGAIFHDVTLSREPGWLEGVLEGKRGLIPENYVEIL
uniref:Rho GTPase activating protein 10 n=1 Tax=Cyprinus carpio TaxID=7962 RepID=A0A8C1GCR2_CYPCA